MNKAEREKREAAEMMANKISLLFPLVAELEDGVRNGENRETLEGEIGAQLDREFPDEDNCGIVC